MYQAQYHEIAPFVLGLPVRLARRASSSFWCLFFLLHWAATARRRRLRLVYPASPVPFLAAAGKQSKNRTHHTRSFTNNAYVRIYTHSFCSGNTGTIPVYSLLCTFEKKNVKNPAGGAVCRFKGCCSVEDKTHPTSPHIDR